MKILESAVKNASGWSLGMFSVSSFSIHYRRRRRGQLFYYFLFQMFTQLQANEARYHQSTFCCVRKYMYICVRVCVSLNSVLPPTLYDEPILLSSFYEWEKKTCGCRQHHGHHTHWTGGWRLAGAVVKIEETYTRPTTS